MSRRFMFDCSVGMVGAALALLAGGVGEARAGDEVHEDQKLTASDAGHQDFLGFSVSVSGDTAVVGAYADGCAAGANCGSAYVYRFDGATWVEEQKLTASDAAANDWFGRSVSVSGDTAVVGAELDDCAAGSNCGSAYVYRFDGATWVEEQKLTASDAAEDAWFGWSVSVSGDTAVVGTTGDNCAPGLECGSAYVYRFDGGAWAFEQKLTASDTAAEDQFGVSVSVSGDTAVVGAHGNDDACPGDPKCDSGSAYVYRFGGATWVEEQKLTASDAAVGDSFGGSVSVSSGTAVVGAWADGCAAGANCGSAYVYRFDGATWVEEQKLTASDAAANDWFGRSVSVSGDTAVVGAFGDDCEAGLDCGSAYVFDLSAEPCEGDANGDGLVDPLDSGFVLARFGCPVGTGDPGCDIADMNGDGLVDPLDVGFVLARFGTCD